jgi:hypothetical protein
MSEKTETTVVSVRFSAEELAQLDWIAEQIEWNRSEVIKHLVRQVRLVSPPMPPVFTLEKNGQK